MWYNLYFHNNYHYLQNKYIFNSQRRVMSSIKKYDCVFNARVRFLCINLALALMVSSWSDEVRHDSPY
jgi:hypothetical protein